MYLKILFLLIGVSCFSCSANDAFYGQHSNVGNGKSKNPGLGLNLFPEGLLSPDLKLPEAISGHCKEDFERYRNAILHPSRDTLWAYKSKIYDIAIKFRYF